MEIVIGITPDQRFEDAVVLGLAICDSVGGTPVFTHVYPKRFDYVSMGHVDAEWEKYLVDRGNELLDQVRSWVERPAEYELFGHASSGRGLAEVAKMRGADLIVIGSAPGGSEGQITRGSTSDRLLHGSPVPVAVAPREFHATEARRVKRVVFAYQPTEETQYALAEAVEFAEAAGAELHLISVLERRVRIYMRLGPHAEDPIMAALVEQFQGFMDEAAASIPIPCTTQVLVGDTINVALRQFDWEDEDLLVVGSSGVGPVLQVFMGDTSYKLMRASTVPLMLIPHSSEAALAEDEHVAPLMERMKLRSWRRHR